MLKKLLILLFLFLGIISCKINRIEAIGLENSLYRIEGISTAQYNNAPYLLIEKCTNNEKGIRYDSLGIEIAAKTVYTGIALNNVGIIKSAHAMKKFVEVFDEVAEIQVTSNKDYNEEHVSGANLLHILSARSSRRTVKAHYRTDKEPVMEVFKELDYDGYLLSFNVPPSNSEQHIFTITISTTDGKTFSTTTEEVFLRKN